MRKRSVLVGVIAAAASALAVPSAASAADATPFIIGGHDATEEYSFVASLQTQGQHFCGGSLIKPDYIVTAAHCVAGNGDFTVRVGSNDNTSGGETANAAEVTTHPTADLAVVRLDKALQAEPIEIAQDSGAPGTASRIIGWGQTCPESGCGQLPTTLQELDTQIVADGDCMGIDGAAEICTDNPNGDSGACYGDSGGPQIKGTPGNWQLIGATSRAGNNDPTCATAPSIYADVSANADWIAQNTAG